MWYGTVALCCDIKLLPRLGHVALLPLPEVVLFNLAVNGASIHPQKTGRFGFVPTGLFQGVENGLGAIFCFSGLAMGAAYAHFRHAP